MGEGRGFFGLWPRKGKVTERVLDEFAAEMTDPSSKVVIKTRQTDTQDQPKKPRKPRRSKEEIKVERAQRKIWLGEQSRKHGAEDREKQLSLGITHYTWQSSGDERTCVECAKNDGKRFSWDKPPKTGHPGEGLCCAPEEGHCRCVALPYIET